MAVGEDGPTHQPVETVSGLRVIPNLDVIRPADPEETAGAWMAALQRADGPTALILTRQKVATLNDIPVETRRQGVLKGGYVARPGTGQAGSHHPCVRFRTGTGPEGRGTPRKRNPRGLHAQLLPL